MSAWNANDNAPTLEVLCAGAKTDLSGLSGTALVNKLKEVAKNAGISKFDVYDANNDVLSPTEIEEGDFTGTLRIERYNTAA